jgi:hypothetical protein
MGASGFDFYRSIVEKYDWDIDTMMQIMVLESNLNPNAVGDLGTAYVSCGLLQVRTLPGRPTCEELKDPERNISYAYEIYKTQGYNAWYNAYQKVISR